MTDRITLADGQVLDLARFPLPEGASDDGTPLSRTELARVFDVSENTITDWIGKGMPVLSGGRNGVAYALSLSHCWAWRAHREEAEQSLRARRDAQNARNALAFRNLDIGQEEEAGLTAKELREWSEAEYHRNRVAEQRGELVRAARVQELIEDLMGVIRTSMGTLPDHLERELGLQSAEVQIVQRHCDGMLEKLRERIERDVLGPAQVRPLPTAQGALL
ncbi:terminase small subunit [Pseudooceanicola sp. CBS1P-1]|uniref:DUF1441 family protein n=1 Tax=Pseudooceanicola albus TaxID=2692189 RepID=A0A6L7GD09_9RHOB|nr:MULTISPECIES: DUF1441 family protein [Pseudooceanicola]MBT9386963.1 terminase small subunit [Pseudooceanicola endophyticus]MXN21186.1 DUF1441 family protein [Pseudooceanicola albus]